jgi:hypothetical protein
LPPAPTVTVIAEPDATANPEAVSNPPAPPPPAFQPSFIEPPPPPPPATTRYSTDDVVGRTGADPNKSDPELVQVYILYPPEVMIVGLPVVLVAAAYVSA